jgi:hypothetical protein
MNAKTATGHPLIIGNPNAREILDAAAASGIAEGKPVAEPAWIACARCDNRWTGLRACHCSACHRIFTGIRGFDIHRRGGRCNDPATVGLVAIARAHWTG